MVPIALNETKNSTARSPREIPTVQLEMERRETAVACNSHTGREATCKFPSKSSSSYHVERRSEDAYTFHKVLEPQRRSEENGVLCQTFLSNIDIITSVKNTLPAIR